MPDGEEESVPIGPVRALRVVAHFVKVERGEQVGNVQPLPDSLGHAQHVAAHRFGARF